MNALDKAHEAIRQGYSWYSEKTVGRRIGQTKYRLLRSKAEVHSALMKYWKDDKRERREFARQPFTRINLTIRSCLKDITNLLGLRQTGEFLSGGPNLLLSTIEGPVDAFAPHSGLAWYALEIERRYDNARRHVWDGNAEWAAIKAFELGRIYAEFQMMRAAGEFFETAAETKERQRDAGRRSEKVSKSVRMSTYFEFLAQGDKPIEAARSAADKLSVSVSTIRNAFPDARLPKSCPE